MSLEEGFVTLFVRLPFISRDMRVSSKAFLTFFNHKAAIRSIDNTTGSGAGV
jgi:hypothetical protein